MSSFYEIGCFSLPPHFLSPSGKRLSNSHFLASLLMRAEGLKLLHHQLCTCGFPSDLFLLPLWVCGGVNLKGQWECSWWQEQEIISLSVSWAAGFLVAVRLCYCLTRLLLPQRCLHPALLTTRGGRPGDCWGKSRFEYFTDDSWC